MGQINEIFEECHDFKYAVTSSDQISPRVSQAFI